LRARVVDDAHLGIANARVELADLKISTTSAHDGSIALEIPLDTPHAQLVAAFTCPRYASRWSIVELAPGQTTTLGDVVLGPGASIAGRVVDRDGAPRENANVWATGVEIFGSKRRAALTGPDLHPGAPSAISDAEGRFRIEGVGAGQHRVWANAKDMRYAWSEPARVDSGAQVDGVVLTLVPIEASDSIDGVVLDPHGAPVPDAQLSVEFRTADWSSNHARLLDASARFHLLIEGDAPHDLRATDARGRWPEAVAFGVLPGARDVVLQFSEATRLDVLVRDAQKNALADFTLYAQRARDATSITLTKTERPEPGRARIRVPSEAFVLTALGPGFAPKKSDVLDPQHLPESVTFDLDALPGISGVVQHDGHPIANASVQLFAPPESGRCYERDGYPIRFRSEPLCSATTDADGRFLLTTEKSGDLTVLVANEGFATAEVGPLHVDARSGGANLVIQLDRGGTIECDVLMPPGQSAEGGIVSVNRGDTFPRTARADANGRVRFDQLAAGKWQVRRAERMIDGNGHTFALSACDRAEFEHDCVVTVGATTRFALDLRDDRPCTLHGVLEWGGAPALGWTVALWPESGVLLSGSPPSTSIDEHGAFELSTPNKGRYRLTFERGDSSGSLAAEVELAKGTQTWHRSIDRATLTVKRTNASAPELTVLWETNELAYYGAAKPNQTTTLEVPAGRVTLGTYVHDSGLALSKWSEALAVDLAPNEERAVEID
jgi:hypothetical protein